MARLPVFLEWLTREVYLYLHYCKSIRNSLLFALVNVELLLSFPSASLAVSCLIFLTTIWGQSVVFTFLICTIGISALITWTSIGVISIRFREAYKAQRRSLSDLPYRQPFYPLLPIVVIVLGIVMCIASGYSTVKQKPFKVQVSTIFFKKVFLKTHTLYIFRIFFRHMSS